MATANSNAADFDQSNDFEQESTSLRTLEEIMGIWVERQKKALGRPGALMLERLKNLDHSARKPLFDSEGETYEAMQELFDGDVLCHIVKSACSLSQLSRDESPSIGSLGEYSSPADRYGAAADLLSWAKAVKFLADVLFIRAAALNDTSTH